MDANAAEEWINQVLGRVEDRITFADGAVRWVTMTEEEYREKRQLLANKSRELEEAAGTIDGEIHHLDVIYFGQLYKQGDAVIYQGEKYHIAESRVCYGTATFNLRKPKKDGSPSLNGRMEHHVSIDQLKPWPSEEE